jgi:hypothetical protein
MQSWLRQTLTAFLFWKGGEYGMKRQRKISVSEARFYAKKSQWKVALETGMHQSSISAIERGVRKASPDERARIAKSVGKRVDDLCFIYLRGPAEEEEE